MTPKTIQEQSELQNPTEGAIEKSASSDTLPEPLHVFRDIVYVRYSSP
jgi:hypothetical protein